SASSSAPELAASSAASKSASGSGGGSTQAKRIWPSSSASTSPMRIISSPEGAMSRRVRSCGPPPRRRRRSSVAATSIMSSETWRRRRWATCCATLRSLKPYCPPTGVRTSNSDNSRTSSRLRPVRLRRRLSSMSLPWSGGARPSARRNVSSLRQRSGVSARRAAKSGDAMRPAASCVTTAKSVLRLKRRCSLAPRAVSSRSTRLFGSRSKRPATKKLLPSRRNPAMSTRFAAGALLLAARRGLLLLGGLALARGLARGRRLHRLQRLLQRRHEVDDRRRLGHLGGDDLLALELRLDEIGQRRLVAVGEQLRIEGGGLLGDDLLRQGDRRLVERPILDVFEIRLLAPHFLGRAQRADHDALAAWAEQHGPLARGQHETADARLVLALHCLDDDAERLVRHLAVGRQPIGAVEVERVDLVVVDELRNIDDAVALDLDLVELLIGDDDVAPLLELVALEQLLARHRLARGGVGRHHLDARHRAGRQVVEGDLVGAARRGIEPHRAGDQTDPQIAFPARSRRSHGVFLSRREYTEVRRRAMVFPAAHRPRRYCDPIAASGRRPSRRCAGTRRAAYRRRGSRAPRGGGARRR